MRIVKGEEMDLEKLRVIAGGEVDANIDAHIAKMQKERKRREAVKDLEAAMSTRLEAYKALSEIVNNHPGLLDDQSESFIVGTQLVPLGTADSVAKRNLRATVQNYYSTDQAVDVQIPDEISVRFALEAEDGDLEKGIFRILEDLEDIGIESDGRVIKGQIIANESFRVAQACGQTLYYPNSLDIIDAKRQQEAVEAETPTITGTLELIQSAIEATRQ